jgi:hypothetical protein
MKQGRKGYYVDGHGNPSVVECHSKFVKHYMDEPVDTNRKGRGNAA